MYINIIKMVYINSNSDSVSQRGLKSDLKLYKIIVLINIIAMEIKKIIYN